MSATKLLSEVLKSAATASSVSGLSTMLVDSSGSLSKTNPQNLAQQIFITKACGDIDNLVTPGIYNLTDSSIGTFPGGLSRCRWGMVEVYLRGQDVYQCLMEVTFMAVRRCDKSKMNWCIWREINFVASAT